MEQMMFEEYAGKPVDFYTTYLGSPKIRDGHYDKIKVIVTASRPKGITHGRYKYEPGLAPEWKTVQNFKFTGNFGWLRDAYTQKLNKLRRIKGNVLNGLMDLIKEYPGQIVLVCYCKDVNRCHRKVLAEYIADKKKLTWEEL